MTARPAFWLWAVVCAIGVYIAGSLMGAQVRAFPVGAALGAVLLVPVLVLGVWLLRRLHPVRTRPLGCSLLAVGWGGLAAFGLALPVNAAFQAVVGTTAGPDFASAWGPAIVAPVDEEILKLLGVALLGLAVPAAVRGPLDGYGYGALVGLGFLVSENFLYVLNTIVLTGATQDANAALFSIVSRMAGGVWWSHWAMTAVAGAGLGCLFGRASRGAVALACGGFALALAMHSWWDAPMLSGVALLPVKGAPILAVAVVVYRVVRRRYLVRFRRAAESETAGGVLVPGEGHVLAYRKWRRKERWDVPAGEPRLLLARLRTAELDLLDGGLGGLEPDPLAADRLRADIRALRGSLNAAQRPRAA
ncbi:PrsW family glutamic-type intramembrane protease [Actinomadura fibrosa]|uniref:PrsW family glutamic-type intramembrane protease n=1 Tax=Actinomadura fibrosa TaxID=111802 RepID=A0ABW2XT08_9ACTN|nr:PrsW family glutamic-type intramembrane protease [Actinomadura fibrosa]